MNRWRWPAIVVGLLGAHMAACAVFVYLAVSNPSFAVEEDYYQKALDWDRTRAQQRHNQALGWRLDFAVDPPAAPGEHARLRVRLTDRGDTPLGAAEIEVVAFHKARSREVLRAHLVSARDGTCSAPVPMTRAGLWELRFTVQRKGDVFTSTTTRHLELGR